ncbi:hypothetical protein E3N88_15483 [Mikania micrantha]|uniref:Uncharacterized protein n=1 Tax=Mikania micrantha TaxID=192012 RepID=A0A5N6NXS3_9ASTR|nr:hypothetical protein E3N88_15483 [Mikania micrantha]
MVSQLPSSKCCLCEENCPLVSIQACSSKGSSNINALAFVQLLEEVCNNVHSDKIECVDVMLDLFWSKFAAIWNSRIHERENLNAEACERVAKSLRLSYLKSAKDGRDTLLRKGLDNIFNQHYSLFSDWDFEIPETPPVSPTQVDPHGPTQVIPPNMYILQGPTQVTPSSMQTTSTVDDVMSKAIQDAMNELLDNDLLDYTDVMVAEEYIFKSKMVANHFVNEKNLEKKRKIILKSNNSMNKRVK